MAYRRRADYLYSRALQQLKETSPGRWARRNRWLQAARAGAWGHREPEKGRAASWFRRVRPGSSHVVLGVDQGAGPKVTHDLQVEKLGMQDVEAISDFVGWTHGSAQHKDLEARLEAGDTCYAVRTGGFLAALGWALRRHDGSKEPGEVAWLKEFSVSPVHANPDLFPALVSSMAADCLKDSPRVCIRCSRTDKRRIGELKAIGFRPVA
jgi:hypothetical protein